MDGKVRRSRTFYPTPGLRANSRVCALLSTALAAAPLSPENLALAVLSKDLHKLLPPFGSDFHLFFQIFPKLHLFPQQPFVMIAKYLDGIQRGTFRHAQLG